MIKRIRLFCFDERKSWICDAIELDRAANNRLLCLDFSLDKHHAF